MKKLETQSEVLHQYKQIIDQGGEAILISRDMKYQLNAEEAKELYTEKIKKMIKWTFDIEVQSFDFEENFNKGKSIAAGYLWIVHLILYLESLPNKEYTIFAVDPFETVHPELHKNLLDYVESKGKVVYYCDTTEKYYDGTGERAVLISK